MPDDGDFLSTLPGDVARRAQQPTDQAGGAAPAATAPTGGGDFLTTLPAEVAKRTGAPSTVPDASVAKPGDIDPITGRPYQFATAGTPGPVGQATGTQPPGAPPSTPREDLVPGPSTQAVISLGSTPEQRLRIAASRLFPGDDPKDAQSRMFYDSGRLAAVAKDGTQFYVDPAPYSPNPMAPTFGGVARSFVPSVGNVASTAGPALPAVGGVAGGAVGGPMAPVTAAAGAATGDIIRQIVASRFDPSSPDYNPLQTAYQAGGAGAGQFVGGLVAGELAPNLFGLTKSELKNLPNALQRGTAAAEAAEKQGVPLSVGQATGLPSLLSKEDVVASGSVTPQAQNIAQTFYQMQRQKLTDAYDKMLSGTSSQADKTDAALQFQQAAEDATRIARQQANAAARPAYQAAEQGGQVMSPDLAQLADQPAVKTAMDATRTDYQNLYRKPAPDTPDFALWDLTKRKLDDAYGIAQRAGENTQASAIDSLRGDLKTHLDAAYPTYPAAREAAAPGQALSARLQEVLGTKGAPDLGTDRAWQIVRPVFEGNNPRAISEARDAFTAAGRSDEWNAGTRAYLQDLFDQASKSQEGLNPSMLLRQVWNDPNRRAALQAAMDPQAFQGLDNFMGTLQSVAQSRGMNSLTQPRAAGAAQIAEAAASQPAARTARFIGAVLSPQTYWQGAKTITDPIANWLTKKNVDRIATQLFDDRGMSFLRAMADSPSGGMKALTAVSRFLGQQEGADRYQQPANTNQQTPQVNALAATPYSVVGNALAGNPRAQTAVSQFQQSGPTVTPYDVVRNALAGGGP